MFKQVNVIDIIKKTDHYDEHNYVMDRPWKDYYSKIYFSDIVRIIGLDRGRSAARFIAYSEFNNSMYIIFMTDFLDMVLNNDVKDGIIEGEFKVTKHGSNLGIRLKDTPKRSIGKVNDYHNYNTPIPEYL